MKKTAKDAILARIRGAIANALEPPPIPHDFRERDERDRAAILEDFIDRRAKGFSRGQQMKVALGRALVHEPHNIMLDEPTNGLDVATSRAVRDLLRRLRGEGRCILLTSHIMQEVSALADRIVVLAEGRIVLQGAPAELRRATGLHDLEEIFMAATQGAAAEPAFAAGE